MHTPWDPKRNAIYVCGAAHTPRDVTSDSARPAPHHTPSDGRESARPTSADLATPTPGWWARGGSGWRLNRHTGTRPQVYRSRESRGPTGTWSIPKPFLNSVKHFVKLYHGPWIIYEVFRMTGSMDPESKGSTTTQTSLVHCSRLLNGSRSRTHNSDAIWVEGAHGHPLPPFTRSDRLSSQMWSYGSRVGPVRVPPAVLSRRHEPTQLTSLRGPTLSSFSVVVQRGLPDLGRTFWVKGRAHRLTV